MGAIPVHHTATTNDVWDAGKAVRGMPAKASVLRYCFAWRDSSADPDLKGSYSFPHHAEEGGPAYLNGVRNALSRLSQSDVPADQQDAVRRHLEAHLADGQEGSNHVHHTNLTTRQRLHNRAGERRDWYRIVNAAELGTAQIYVYDEIGYFGVTAAEFVYDLNTLNASKIDVHINSPGGEVFDGIAIFNALKNHPANVTCYVDALAASAASFIAQAGDRVVMARNATMMIHDASGLCIGNAADMRTLADLLDKSSDTIASIYADRAGGGLAHWRNLMKAESWFNADEAVTAGLADVVAGSPGATPEDIPRNAWDLSVFRYAGRERAPAPELANKTPTPPPSPTPTPAGVAAESDIEWDSAAFLAAVRKGFNND